MSGRAPLRAGAGPRVAVLALAAALAALAGCSDPADAQGGPPPAPSVSVAPAVQRTVVESEDFSGRLEAAESVELRPRVGGTVERVHFVDGATVRRGQLLFTIDPRPFAAEVARAEAQLASVRARSELAQSELARARRLLEEQAVSRQEVEQLSSGQRTSQAEIQGAEAALRIARLNVEYAQVRSPIDGRLSRTSVTAGNVVDPQSVLTTIVGTGRVYATFEGSERTFLRLQAARAAGRQPTVRMGLLDEAGFPHEGRVDFVDNRLNAQTGAVRLRATFDNAAGRFVPGLTARLRMEGAVPQAAVLVPDRAIGTDQTRKVVYVVGADGRPQPREVRLGALLDGMRVVQGGTLKPGENVVVEGLQRIVPGMPVAPRVLAVDAQGMPVVPPPAPPAAPGGGSGASGART